MYYFFGLYWMWVNRVTLLNNPVTGERQILHPGWNPIQFLGKMSLAKTDWGGEIYDIFGKSQMMDVNFGGEQFVFTKKYPDHLAPVIYTLEQQKTDPSLWVGEWKIPFVSDMDHTAHGPARINLREVNNPRWFQTMPEFKL